MFKVGVTGGIGSGKSVVCRIFRNLGVAIYEADNEARRIIVEDTDIRKELVKNFGNKLFSEGQLDRKYLAARIFSDSDARIFVNGLIHPRVREDFMRWTENQEGAYVIEEAALLFESGAWKEMDFNILVTAKEEIRINRIMNRDGIQRGDVLARLASQIDPYEAAKLADLILQNDENEFVIPQVLSADRLIRDRLSGENV
ncbi:MAG TPA: dephospho-CoA kinase [Bacteroides sp.]|nr:dephospho-CoA kinase [Bacteroides sp.]